MRLSKEDKYELARAAIKARDVESLRDYIVSVVDAFDELPPGKADVPCPRYAEPGAASQNGANGHHGTRTIAVSQDASAAREQWGPGLLPGNDDGYR